MPEPIVGVVGLTRSGSTLAMRMLWQGGLPVIVDNYESFETSMTDQRSWTWLYQYRGHAVKLLNPISLSPLPRLPWRFIFMRRDPLQQARSQAKLLKLLGVADLTGDAAIATLARANERDTPRTERYLRQYGAVLVVDFERLLADPDSAAERMARFVPKPLNVAAMAAQVVPRNAACLEGMLEFDLMNGLPLEIH